MSQQACFYGKFHHTNLHKKSYIYLKQKSSRDIKAAVSSHYKYSKAKQHYILKPHPHK